MQTFLLAFKELMAATCMMQSSSNELSTLVSDNTKCKQMKANTYIKLGGF